MITDVRRWKYGSKYILEWKEDGKLFREEFDCLEDVKYEYDIIKECVEDVE